MSIKINGKRVAGRGKDGAGVAAGGAAGQVLTKRNGVDYDTEWTDLPVIDATLSNAGQVADAKAVGDQISSLESAVASTYETKEDATSKLTEVKAYADDAATAVKNDLLNGAGEAYDTLKELGDLITENTSALEALESVASGKQDKLAGFEGQIVGFDTDGNAVAQDAIAEIIAYDNTTSGLTATNVQAAIDEIDSTIDSFATKSGGDTLTWDGDTTGLVSVSFLGSDWYKVSNSTPTKTDCANGWTIVQSGSSVTMGATQVQGFFSDEYLMICENGVLFIPSDNYVLNSDVTFPEAGTYFLKNTDGIILESLTIPNYTGYASVTIKDSAISDNIQRIITGTAGQVVGFDADGNAVAVDTTVNMAITIPAGRLIGDINGDGVVDASDCDYIGGVETNENHVGSAGIVRWGTLSEMFPDGNVPIDYLAANANNDDYISTNDILTIIAVAATYTRCVSSEIIDLLGNWSILTEDELTDTTEYVYYKDFTINGVTTSSNVIINLGNNAAWLKPSGDIISANTIRIWAKWPPITEINASVTVTEGAGTVAITGTSDVENKVDAKLATKMDLVDVTVDDDGGFMRVVNGKWAVAFIASAEEASF